MEGLGGSNFSVVVCRLICPELFDAMMIFAIFESPPIRPPAPTTIESERASSITVHDFEDWDPKYVIKIATQDT